MPPYAPPRTPGTLASIPDFRAMLPDEVRSRIELFFGERGRAWMEALPGVVADLERRWELRLGARAYGGGSHSLVLPATREDGTPAVLKVPVRDGENRLEAAALRLYAGDGATLLYAADEATGALLLERLEPGTPLFHLPDRDRAIDTASALLRRLRRPAPADHRFRPVPHMVRGWSRTVPAGLARHRDPLPAPVRLAALAALEALATPADGGRPVLVNRDGHTHNMLAAEREPWLLIDPKPLVGEPAFDGGWLLIDALRPAPSAAAADRFAERIGAGLGVPAERVRAWALCRAVEDVLWSLDLGEDPALYAAVAASLAGA
jgi:streptomycin 6-kinase